MADPGAASPAEAGGLRYAGRRGRMVVVATVLGSGLAALDATVVGIALPAIGREFDADVAGLQWVVNAYTLTLAGLLLLAGALGDRFGRRRVFLIGVVWFALASLLCAVAWSVAALVAARALQGVGAALLTPGSLAILQASFTATDRAKAIGAWSGLGGIAMAVGPFLGGYLIEALSWRLVFFINLPVTVAVIVLTMRYVPESRDPQAEGQRLDVVGAVLAAAGLAGVSYGLTEGAGRGWTSPAIVAALGAGVAALGAFVAAELRVRRPMLPMSVFRSKQFSAANAVTFVVYAALAGVLFLLPVVLQEAYGYSPVQAGTALLPVTLIMLLLSARSGALAARIGPRLQMSAGPVVVAAGVALFARLDSPGDYLTQVLPAVVVLGLGLAATVAPLTSTVLAAAPAEQAGVASAVNNTVARAAGLIAVAVLPVAAGITGAGALEPERLAAGFRTAALLAVPACLAGGLIALAAVRNPAPSVAVPESGRKAPEMIGPTHCALDAPPLRGRACLRTPSAVKSP